MAVIVNIVFVVGFLAIFSLFYRYIFSEIKSHQLWILFFALAILLKIIAIGTDIVYKDITEDYFEVFSLYFFTVSYIAALFEI